VENIEKNVQQYETNEQQRRQSIRHHSQIHFLDPIVQKRKESYHALISELHEIMGLPALKPLRPSLLQCTGGI
jgi:uncharacterized protein YPO0396